MSLEYPYHVIGNISLFDQTLRRLTGGVIKLGVLPSNLSFPRVAKRIRSDLLGAIFPRAISAMVLAGSARLASGKGIFSVYDGLVATLDTHLLVLRLFS